jgi:hypothetical protein
MLIDYGKRRHSLICTTRKPQQSPNRQAGLLAQATLKHGGAGAGVERKAAAMMHT